MALSLEASMLATVAMFTAGAVFDSEWMRSLVSLYLFKYKP